MELLFSRDKKRSNRETVKNPLAESDYNDIEYIRNAIIESLPDGLPPNWEPPLRVILTKTKPHRCFRVSIICRWPGRRSIKNKEGSTTVFAGLSVAKQYWVEKISPSEYVFTPPLQEI